MNIPILPEGWERGDELDIRYPHIINWNSRDKDASLEGMGTLVMTIRNRDEFDAWLKWFEEF